MTRQLGVRIDTDLKMRLEAAVAALQGLRPDGYTLRLACEDALTKWVEQVERNHNGGHPFPPVPGGLAAGRPPRAGSLAAHEEGQQR